MRQSTLLDGIPTRFNLEVVCGDVSSKISIDHDRGSLNISTSPETVPEAKELFAALHRWGATNRPPKWQQIWRTWNGIQWGILVIALMVGLLATVSGNPYKAQAREFLKNGVSGENQQRAIELLLAIQSEYRPPGEEAVFPTWFLLLFFGGLVISLVTSFMPKSVLGIGKGQDRINHWRFWFNIVFYLVPSFIFLNLIWPLISARVLPK